MTKPPKLRNSVILTLFGFTATVQSASLEAPPAAIVDEIIKVEYSGPGEKGDEMTIGTREGVELLGTNPADLSGDGEGLVNLLMPSRPGSYTIIYRGDDGVLTTRPIRVTPSEYVVRTAGSMTTSGELSVLWKGVSDGRGIVALRNGDGQVVSRKTVPADTGSGTLTLKLPGQPGSYEVSYMQGKGILATQPIVLTEKTATNLTAPAQVNAGQDFVVYFSGPFNYRDRIVMAPEGDSTSGVLSYSYLSPATGQVTMTSPNQAGLYSLHYQNQAGEVLSTARIQVLKVDADLSELVVTAAGDYEISGNVALEVILDASGSMLQDESGEDRIEIAKETLLDFMNHSIPPGTPFALRAFGHIAEGSCASELLVPLAPFDYQGMSPIVRGIEAINLAKTPIASSLTLVSSDLSEATGKRRVLLLTDGKETCDGDPTQAILTLRAEHPELQIDIVGYAIGSPEIRDDFASWAAYGGGRYFDAKEAEELGLALNEATSIPFSVYDGVDLVASGLTGETVLKIPAGTYDLSFLKNGVEVRKSITVAQEGRSLVTSP